MRVLITGGAGRLGKCLAEELTAHGHRVTLFDRRSPEEGLAPWQTDLPFVRGDLTSAFDVQQAIAAAGAEAICHLGALTSGRSL